MLRMVMTSLQPSLLHSACTTVLIPVLALGTNASSVGSQSMQHITTPTHRNGSQNNYFRKENTNRKTVQVVENVEEVLRVLLQPLKGRGK